METQKRHSKKREAIFEAICATKNHPSAEWVYAQLKPALPDLSLGTVYRNIALFRGEGRVACVGVVNGQERYDGDTVPHTHFICNGCGAVLDVEGIAPSQELCDLAAHALDARVFGCQVNFYGLCAACK